MIEPRYIKKRKREWDPEEREVFKKHKPDDEPKTSKGEELERYWLNVSNNPDSLPEFDLEELFNTKSKHIEKEGIWDPSILINGTRRTGKSVLAKHIVTKAHEKGLVGRISVLTGTPQNGFWDDLAPCSTIYDLSQPVEVLHMIRNFQIDIVEAFKDGEEIPLGILQHTIILDDFIGDKSFARYSDELHTAIINFRHYCTCIILLTQYPTGVGPSIRANADFAFIFIQAGENVKRHMYNDHLNFISDKKHAYNILEQVPRDFKCLVVHKTDPYLKDNEKVSWFRAEDEDSKYPDNHATLHAGNPEWRRSMLKKDEILKRKRKEERKKRQQKSFQLSGPVVDELSSVFQDVLNLKQNIIKKLQ